MNKNNLQEPKQIASQILQEIQALPIKNTPNLRKIQKKYSRLLKDASAQHILEIARELYHTAPDHWYWIGFDLIRYHPDAMSSIGIKELEEFSSKMSNWGHSDLFAALLAGPAWQQGQIPDSLVDEWAHSGDKWWRRNALVCTIALNRKSMGGTGDVPRTLHVCRLLAGDKDDNVIKAMSWALRELIPYDVDAVRQFLKTNDNILAAQVKREVNNKITTGAKNPKKSNGKSKS